MQLSCKKATSSLRARLAFATCAVIGISLAHADNYVDDSGTVAESATEAGSADLGGLLYQENGGRVKSAEGVVNLRHVTPDEDHLGINLTLDTLSGGSPNGAIASKATQTFSSPSGNTLTAPAATPTTPTVQTCTTASGTAYSCGSSAGGGAPKNSIYTVAPGEQPLDKTFHDQREAVALSWDSALTRTSRYSLGGAYSHELDFQSVSVNAGLTQDFNQKNTTLSAAINIEHDSNNPIGGTPVPLTDYALFQKQGNKGKQLDSVVVGVSQIMTRRWLTQLNYSFDHSHGYQNDPYKIVSGLDSNGNVVGYIYENRPDNRLRRGLYWENRYAFDADTVTASYRYTGDNWGVVSHTAELKYRFEMGGGHFIEPQFRWYRQTAANFYRLYVLQGQPYLHAVSADPRLAEFTGRTIGLKYGYAFDKAGEISVRALRYVQQGTVQQAILPNLQGLDLYPGLKATALSADLQFKF